MFPALNSFPLAEKTVPASFGESPEGRRSIVSSRPMDKMITRRPLGTSPVFEGQMEPHEDPASGLVQEFLNSGTGVEFLDTDLLADQYDKASAGGRRALERATISPAVLYEVLARIGGHELPSRLSA